MTEKCETMVDEALDLLKKSADQGNADAQNQLAWLYKVGDGVEQSNEKALELWIKAAGQNHPAAQYNLGECYYYGLSFSSDEWLSIDKVKAAELFLKSAKNGYADAQMSIGICFYNGIGVTKDKDKAFEWWCKAVEQGQSLAQHKLEYVHKTEFERWKNKKEQGGEI